MTETLTNTQVQKKVRDAIALFNKNKLDLLRLVDLIIREMPQAIL